MKIERLGARTMHRRALARVALKMESRDGSGRGSKEHGVCRARTDPWDTGVSVMFPLCRRRRGKARRQPASWDEARRRKKNKRGQIGGRRGTPISFRNVNEPAATSNERRPRLFSHSLFLLASACRLSVLGLSSSRGLFHSRRLHSSFSRTMAIIRRSRCRL